MWGCVVKVMFPNAKIDKIGDNNFDGVFFGYDCHSRAYRFLFVKSYHNDYSPNAIRESHDAIFYKNIFSYKHHTKYAESSTPFLESSLNRDSNNNVALRSDV